MKKFLIVLAIVGFVFMGCSMDGSGSDSPRARLQGKWYNWDSFGNLDDDWFIEFKGNTMRYYEAYNHKGEVVDDSGSFTCTETVITATLPIDYGDNELHYFTYTIPYTIKEKRLNSGVYTALYLSASSYFYPDSYWCRKK